MLVGFAIPRTSALDATWTTVHLAQAFLRRGHGVRFIEPWDFEVDDRAQLTARAHCFDPPAVSHDVIVRRLHRRAAGRRYLRVDTLDLLLLRAAPLDPSLMAFGAMALERGVPVINDPAGLFKVSHKAWLAGLKDVPKPPTLVTQSPAAAHLFYDKLRSPVIVKPARGSGGALVSFVKRRQPGALDEAFAAARSRGEHVIIQGYVSEADEGEKRIVWHDGDVLGAYLRTRAQGEFRHNLKQGGVATPTSVTPAEQAACDALSPHLLAAGIRLAGIDLIGGQIIEVNAVNPGGVFHADRLHDTDLAATIVQRLEAHATTPVGSQAWARHVP